MKNTLLYILLTSPFFANAQVKETPADSKINNVTVFFKGAQVERTAVVQLNPGSNIVRLSRLSYYIDPNSIQVEGSNKYTIVSVNHKTNYLNETEQSPEFIKLREEGEKVQYEIDMNRASMAILTEEKNMIDANKNFIGVDKAVTVDDMMDMSELYQTRYKTIATSMLDLKKKEKELNKKMALLNSQMAEVQKLKNRNTSDIIINLTSSAKATASINFKYVVGNAGWVPSYDAKASDIKSPLALTYKAKVYQNTGEDWKNINLTLSTGNPTKNNNLPQMSVWTIDGYDYVEAEKRRKEAEEKANRADRSRSRSAAYETGAGKSEAVAVGDEPIANVTLSNSRISNEESKLESVAQYTTVQETSVNTEFKIAIPYTVLSDGKEYSVEIQQIALDTKYRYYAAPKYDASAFLVGFISGWEKHNLISGLSNVYFMDSYIGTSWLETQTTLDSLELSLGRDKSIIIERKKIKDYTKPSFSGSTKKVTIAIELIVKNTKSTSILLDLEDQIPVSRNKEIEIETVDLAGGTLTATTGALKWNLDIAAGDSKKLTFIYTVKYPKDKEISTF